MNNGAEKIPNNAESLAYWLEGARVISLEDGPEGDDAITLFLDTGAKVTISVNMDFLCLDFTVDTDLLPLVD